MEVDLSPGQKDGPRHSIRPYWDIPAASNGRAEWKAGQSSLQGLKEFWLRVDLVSHSAEPTLAVQAMDIAIGFQHNMHLQPRLVPGENPLWLEDAQVDDGTKLQAEWIYQLDGDERRAGIGLEQAGKAEQTVLVDVDRPSRILMTGIKLNCL